MEREEGGGTNVASHAHSPRAEAWAGVTAARGVALETATARCRGDITSESYDSREARERPGTRRTVYVNQGLWLQLGPFVSG